MTFTGLNGPKKILSQPGEAEKAGETEEFWAALDAGFGINSVYRTFGLLIYYTVW